MPRTGRKENLIDAAHRTEEELRRMTRNGGIKSGEVRRKRKTFRQALEMLLMDAKLSEPVKLKLKEAGVAEEDMNHMTVILRSLIAKAEAGDVQAFNAIIAQLGEKPADNMNLGIGTGANIVLKYVGDKDCDFPSSEDEVDDTRQM
jgi:hypothetical protein